MREQKQPAPKIKLYTKGFCGWCCQVKDYLGDLGWKYEELDVTRDPKLYEELVAISGQDMTPTALIDGKLLADFGTDELEAFLKKENYL